MTVHRLDAGPSTLVIDTGDAQFQLVYIGRQLPPDLDLAEITRFTRPITPHGELDVTIRPTGFPTENGLPQLQAALQARRQSRALQIDLKPQDCIASPTQLDITLADSLAGVHIQLSITGCESGVFRSEITLQNLGSIELELDWLAALHLPLPSSHQELERYGGFWANELNSERLPLGQHSISIDSVRGRSSHQSFPVLVSGESGFGQQHGEVLLSALQWSGNHRLVVAPDGAGGHALQAGIRLAAGEIRLASGTCWSAPPALFAFGTHGINSVRQQLQRYWHLQKSGTASAPRPVHFNSWEANYFDHDVQRSCALVAQAKALGAERFVLDDGWMQGRSGPGFGLGDWQPCKQRYPDGLRPVAEQAHTLGLTFGLWVEPEMVTLDSTIAREHPDWIIRSPDRPAVSGRQQYLLNICLPAVQEHLLSCLDRLIDQSSLGYLKWDMNRDYADLGFGDGPGPVAMTEAWYALIRLLRDRHPTIVIEVCAAGGARNDAGSVALADRLWPSDSMDPLQRYHIIKHASSIIPPALMGAHIGASPSSTSGAALPLSTRCIVALLGHMGIELDPATLSDDERAVVLRWTTFYKAQREQLVRAQYHYLDSAEPGLEAVLLFDEQDGSGILLMVRTHYPQHAQPPLLRLPKLLAGKSLELQLLNPEDCAFVQQDCEWQRGDVWQVSGDTLCDSGLRAPFLLYGHCALIRISGALSS